MPTNNFQSWIAKEIVEKFPCELSFHLIPDEVNKTFQFIVILVFPQKFLFWAFEVLPQLPCHQ